MTNREEVEQAYYGSLPPCDILLSHSPPMGLTGEDETWGQLGSCYLRDYIRENQPELVVCGHIHRPRARVETIGGTLVINVATTEKIIEV